MINQETTGEDLVDKWLEENLPDYGPESTEPRAEPAPEPEPAPDPEPAPTPELPAPGQSERYYDHPDEVVRDLLNAGIALRDIRQTSPAVAARLAERVRPAPASPAADAEPVADTPKPDVSGADRIAAILDERLQPVIERMLVSESRARLAGEIPAVASDAEWGKILDRANGLADDVTHGRRPPFADMDGLLRAASREVTPHAPAPAPASVDPRSRSAPTPAKQVASTDAPILMDPDDAVLTAILDSGTLNVDELRGVASRATKRA